MFDFVCASGQTQRAYVEDENGYLSSQRARRGRAWEESSSGRKCNRREGENENGGVEKGGEDEESSGWRE